MEAFDDRQLVVLGQAGVRCCFFLRSFDEIEELGRRPEERGAVVVAGRGGERGSEEEEGMDLASALALAEEQRAEALHRRQRPRK